jgi:hypothetical protein
LPRRAPAIVAATPAAAAVAITTRVARPIALTIAISRRGLRLASRRRISLKILGLNVRNMEKPVAAD